MGVTPLLGRSKLPAFGSGKAGVADGADGADAEVALGALFSVLSLSPPIKLFLRMTSALSAFLPPILKGRALSAWDGERWGGWAGIRCVGKGGGEAQGMARHGAWKRCGERSDGDGARGSRRAYLAASTNSFVERRKLSDLASVEK